MASVPVLLSLASALVVCCGAYGAITRLAQARGVSRQTLYREAHAAATAVEGTQTQQAHAALCQQITVLHQEVAALQEQLRHAVVVSADQQAEFAATAQAVGVSLSSARALLGVVLGDATPSVAALGRLSQEAGRRAGALVAVLDEFSRPLARQLAADEIFSGCKPVLMVVEQDSLCWLSGRRAADGNGDTWVAEFRSFPAAEQITRDRGTGLVKGVERLNRERRAAGRAPVADQDDHFHALRWGGQALRQIKRQAVKALAKAEGTQKEVDRERRQTGGVAG